MSCLSLVQIMDTGEAVIDDENDECDALFTMDDVVDGTAGNKSQSTDEVRNAAIIITTLRVYGIRGVNLVVAGVIEGPYRVGSGR